MKLDKKSAQNKLAVIPVVVQCKEGAPGLAGSKHAVLGSGLGKLAMMVKKLVPTNVSQRAAAQQPSVGSWQCCRWSWISVLNRARWLFQGLNYTLSVSPFSYCQLA